jgi:hypothetical protein
MTFEIVLGRQSYERLAERTLALLVGRLRG